MYYSLVNLEGKTLDAFRDEAMALEALRATVEADPRLAEEVLLLRNSDDGERAGPALMFKDLSPPGSPQRARSSGSQGRAVSSPT